MARDGLSFDENRNPMTETEDLASILEEYETLSEIQEAERRELLERIDEITRRTQTLDKIDAKLEQFSTLLLDIRSQLAGSLKPDSEKKVPKPKLPAKPDTVASNEEINKLEEEIKSQSNSLDDEISSLTHLLEKKKEEIGEKDVTIEQMNIKLDMLTDEKARLAKELEKLNSVIDSWKSQLDLLQQLASSDPRYRVIEALKKHGSLSDIQLAFTMGTSINQLRKYIDDLIELDLVMKGPNGRYIWSGKDFDTTT